MRLHPPVSRYEVMFAILILLRQKLGGCYPITNSNFNEDIREFSLKEDNNSSIDIKTLQKEDLKRYTDTTPFLPITFKHKFPEKDSKQASSSHSRGLVNRDHPGYVPHDYEEYPHIYSYDYSIPDIEHHGQTHHNFAHYGHQYEHDNHHYVGHHYKHYNHALAAKAILWPLAGIALLGAAAALVNSPILLQLGVASGKRKRRDTEEVTGPDLDLQITNWNSDSKENSLKQRRNISTHRKTFQRETLNKKIFHSKQLLFKKDPTTQSPIEDFKVYAPLSMEADDKFVPVPLKVKHV